MRLRDRAIAVVVSVAMAWNGSFAPVTTSIANTSVSDSAAESQGGGLSANDTEAIDLVATGETTPTGTATEETLTSAIESADTSADSAEPAQPSAGAEASDEATYPDVAATATDDSSTTEDAMGEGVFDASVLPMTNGDAAASEATGSDDSTDSNETTASVDAATSDDVAGSGDATASVDAAPGDAATNGDAAPGDAATNGDADAVDAATSDETVADEAATVDAAAHDDATASADAELTDVGAGDSMADGVASATTGSSQDAGSAHDAVDTSENAAADSSESESNSSLSDSLNNAIEGVTSSIDVVSAGQDAVAADESNSATATTTSNADESDSDEASDVDLEQDEVSESPETTSAQEADPLQGEAIQTSLEYKLRSVDGHSYVVRLTAGNDAGIPSDAKLQVTEVVQEPTKEMRDKNPEAYKDRPYKTEAWATEAEMALRAELLAQALATTEEDYVAWTKYLQIAVVASDGSQVKLAAPMAIEVETDAVEPEVAPALDATLVDGEPAATTMTPQVTARSSRVEQEPDGKGGTREHAWSSVVVATDRLGELALAAVASPVRIWQLRGGDAAVLAPRYGMDVRIDEVEAMAPEGGDLEPELGITVTADPAEGLPDATSGRGARLWLRLSAPEGTTGALSAWREGVQVLAPGSAVPVAIAAGERIDLLFDPRYTGMTLVNGDVTLAGAFPEGAEAEIADRAADFADPASIAGADPAEGEFLTTVAAYDMVIEVDGEAYLADASRPVEATVSGAAVSTADPASLEVWRVGEAGATAVGSSTSPGAVSFDASEPGTYLVVERAMLAGTVTASDGQTYEVSVTYGPEAAVPAGSSLSVRELPGDESAPYEAGAAGALAGRDLTYFRAFDISILDPSGTEVKPQAEVEVSIRLADDAVATAEGDPAVLHFPGGPGAAPDVIEPASFAANIDTSADPAADSTSGVVPIDPSATGTDDATPSADATAASDDAAAPSVDTEPGSGETTATDDDATPTSDATAASAVDATPSAGDPSADAAAGTIEGAGASEDPAAPAVGPAFTDATSGSTATTDPAAAPSTDGTAPSLSAPAAELTFSTSSFSVYAVAYTVDFHWGGETHSIPGGTTVFLGEVIEQLHITDFSLTDVLSVSFSDPLLLRVDEVQIIDAAPELVEDDESEELIEHVHTDWRLVSLASFTSDEALTVTLWDGRRVEIPVTDAIYGDDPGETVTAANRPGTRVTADGVTYNLRTTGGQNFADVYAITAGCVIHDQIRFNNVTYLVNDIDQGLSNLTKRASKLDWELVLRAADHPIALPAIVTEPAQDPTADGYVAGNSNSGSYKVWKKATYNASTNSITYDFKYFQSMRKREPLDFIFIYDDSASMYSGTRNSGGVRMSEVQVTRVLLLDAAKALFEANASNGGQDYDFRVYLGGTSTGDNRNSMSSAGGASGFTSYDQVETYLSTYNTGTTDYTVGLENARDMAQASVRNGRTPVVVWLSDFHQAFVGSTLLRTGDYAIADQLHALARVYGLSTDYTWTGSATVRNVCTSADTVFSLRTTGASLKEGVKSLEELIKHAIGYYLDKQVTITDNLSTALGGLTPGASTVDTGTGTAARGKETWVLGGPTTQGDTTTYPAAATFHTESFTVQLPADAVYAGSMPTNGSATVHIDGRKVNEIDPTANVLHTGVTFLLGRMDRKNNPVAGSGGVPSNLIDGGIKFTLTMEGESEPIGTYTATGGTFQIPYEADVVTGEGDDATQTRRVVLELGQTYILHEVESTVEAYNAAATRNPANLSDPKLLDPDKDWVLKVSESGVVTVEPEDAANQTPETSIAPASSPNPARIVLWNQIVVPAQLIPITVKKVWPDTTHPHDAVRFTVYGVDPANADNKFALPVYSENDADSARVQYLTSDDAESDTVWSREVWVPERIEEEGTTYTFYTEETYSKAQLDQAFGENTIFYVNGDSDNPANGTQALISKVGKNGEIVYGQTYSYVIREEGGHAYRDGWYDASYAADTEPASSVSTYVPPVPDHDNWEELPTEDVSTDFQFFFNINGYRHRGSTEDVAQFIEDFGALPNGNYAYFYSSASMNNFYTSLRSIVIHVRDTKNTPNKYYDLTIIPEGNYTPSNANWGYDGTHGGAIFKNIKAPAAWTEYGVASNTYQKVNNVTIETITVTSLSGNTYTLYPGQNSSTWDQEPHSANRQHYTQIARYTSGNPYSSNAKVGTFSDSYVEGIVHHNGSPASSTDAFNVNSGTLTITNAWHPNTLTAVQVVKNWENSEGGAIPQAQRKSSIELAMQGVSTGGTKPVEVLTTAASSPDNNDWTQFATVANPDAATEAGRRFAMTDDPDAAEWTQTYYVPSHNLPDSFTWDAETGTGTATEFTRYTLNETPLAAAEEPGADGVPGEWTQEVTYAEGQEVHEDEVDISEGYYPYTPEATANRYLRFYYGNYSKLSYVNFFRVTYTYEGTTYRSMICLKSGTLYSTDGVEIQNRTSHSVQMQFPADFDLNNISIGKIEISRYGETWQDYDSRFSTKSISTSQNGTTFSNAYTTHEKWTDAEHIDAVDISIPATFTLTNTFTPNNAVKLRSKFTDSSLDGDGRDAIDKVYYKITDSTTGELVDNVEVAVSSGKTPGWGSGNDWAEDAKTVYLPDGTYTIEQSYSLQGSQTRYALDGSKDAFGVKYYVGNGQASNIQGPRVESMQIGQDTELTFQNARKTIPARVSIDWEPGLQTDEDPLYASGTTLRYAINYEKSDGSVASFSEGCYLSTAREVKTHSNTSSNSAFPASSVRETPTQIALDDDNMAEALPDYDLYVESAEEGSGSSATLVFTIHASIKRAPVIVEKSFSEEFTFDDYKGAQLTYTIRRSDGAPIYGTGTTAVTATVQVPTDSEPSSIVKMLLLQDADETRYRPGLDEKTRGIYAEGDTIFLPVLRAHVDLEADGVTPVKYVLSEAVTLGGQQRVYFPVFSDLSLDPDSLFEQANPAGQNVATSTYGAANEARFVLTPLGMTVGIGNNKAPYICKIEETLGEGEGAAVVETPFRKLNDALRFARTELFMDADNPIAIQMLVDYEVPANDYLSLSSSTVSGETVVDNIIMTTAPTSGGLYNFTPTFTVADGRLETDDADRAILRRKSDFTTASLFVVSDPASLATRDIILDGGAVFDITQEPTQQYQSGIVNLNGGLVYVAANGTLGVNGGTTMRNTAVGDNRYGGAVYAEAGGTLSISGEQDNPAEFTRCLARGKQGGAVWAGQLTLTVDHAVFTYCQSGGGGGGLRHDNTAADAKTTVSYSNFEHCYSTTGQDTDSGGALSTTTRKNELSHCNFTDCRSRQQGGAVFQYLVTKTGSEFIASDCTFKDCESGAFSTDNSRAGGATEVQADTVTLTGCSFKDCLAADRGGAVLAWNTNANITLTSCSFLRCRTADNAKNGEGGGLFNNGNVTTLTDCTFDDCYAKSKGGAIYCNAGTTTVSETVSGGSTYIRNCAAKSTGGGALYQNNGTLNWQAGTIDNCFAQKGGGIYQGGNGSCNFSGGTIQNCNAVNVKSETTNGTFAFSRTGGGSNLQGGGVYLGGGTFNLQGGTIAYNDAVTSGGGVFLNQGTFNLKNGVIDHCYATKGGGVGTSGTAALNITKDGDAIMYCEARTVSVTSQGAVTVAFGFANANLGGGVYQNGGTLNLKHDNAAISTCKAYDGGGIYLDGSNSTLSIGENGKTTGGNVVSCQATHHGGGIYQTNGTLKTYNGTLVSANTAASNGGGINLGGGTLEINGGAVSANAATVNGGGISLGGGTFTIKGGTIGGEGAGNSAKKGAGLYLENGENADTSLTVANVFGGAITHNAATGSGTGPSSEAGGGGIAFGGPNVKLRFQGDAQVWDNTMPNPGGEGTVPCNIYLDQDSSEIITTTSTGIKENSHFGVYVPGDKSPSSGSLFSKHGDWDMPFGTFENKNYKNVNRFINDRTSYYSYYYGVAHIEDVEANDDHNIYWVSYVCKITDDEGGLLFTNDKQTAPALYHYLGTGDKDLEGAFDALKNKSFYDEHGAPATPAYVKMLDSTYDLKNEVSVKVPRTGPGNTPVAVALTTASVTDETHDGADHLCGPYDPQAEDPSATVCVIGRGNCTGSLFSREDNSSLTLTNITIDGGAIYDEETKTYSGKSTESDGGLFSGGGDLTLAPGATLRNSVTTGKGGAIQFNQSGKTLTVQDGSESEPRPVIEHCKAEYGGAVALKNGTFNLNLANVIVGCTATNGGGVYVEGGTLNLVGGDENGTENEVVLANLSATNGGAVYQSNGTVNVGQHQQTNYATLSNSKAVRGGAVYIAGGTFNLRNSSRIESCEATEYGGGVYIAGGSFYVYDTASIDGCSATNGGGGAYLQDGSETSPTKITVQNGTVSGNSSANGGGGIAVGGPNTVINLQNGVKVENNTMGTGDDAVDCNVYLDQDSNAIVTTKDLSATAHIGVYVSDDVIEESDETVNDRHGLMALPFGNYPGNKNNLDRIVNDRRPYLYGVVGPMDKIVYWSNIICKVTDAGGRLLYKDAAHQLPAVYAELGFKDSNDADKVERYALNRILKSNDVFYYDDASPYEGTEFRVEMLVEDYTTHKDRNSWMIAVDGGKTITLTTADPNAGDGFPYRGTRGTFATIKHGEGYSSSALFTSKTGVLILENITLDGGAVFNEEGQFTGGLTCTQAGSLVCVMDNNAEVYLRSGATLQNSYNKGTSDQERGGGAISNRSQNGSKDTHKIVMDTGSLIQNCGTDGVGGAVSIARGSFEMKGGRIDNCFALRSSSTANNGFGGAVYIYSATANTPTVFKMSGGEISRCTAGQAGAAVSIEKGARMEISGSPQFGSGEAQNAIEMDGYAAKVNGGEEAYTGNKVRQDIYINGTNGANASTPLRSIVVTGPLMVDGSDAAQGQAGSGTGGESGGSDSGGGGETGASGGSGSSDGESGGTGSSAGEPGGTGSESGSAGGASGGSGGSAGDSGGSGSSAGDSGGAGEGTGGTNASDSMQFLPAGSIWVWADHIDHYQDEKQFAVLDATFAGSAAEDVLTGTLLAFRNARDDETTGNEHDTYLTGVLKDDDEINVYWGVEIKGYRKVILRKVDDAAHETLDGATFELYRGDSSEVYVLKDRASRTSLTMNTATLYSLANGVIWVGELPYGTYYLKEVTAPTEAGGTSTSAYGGNANQWFCLIVDDEGARMSSGFTGTNAAAAKAAALADLQPATP